MDYSKYCVEAGSYEEALEKYKRGETVAKEREQKKEMKVEVVGNKTIVTLGDGRQGVARCNPEDEFDIIEGVKVAIEDIEKRSVKLTDAEKKILDYLIERGALICAKVDLLSDLCLGLRLTVFGGGVDEDDIVSAVALDEEFKWLEYDKVYKIHALRRGILEEISD